MGLSLKKPLKRAFLYSLHTLFQMERRRLANQTNCLPHHLWSLDVSSSGHLLFDACDLLTLSERYGTPLYVVSQSSLQKTYDRFTASFRRSYPNIEVAYSYKTNPLPAVISLLHQFGAAAEVISEFELWLAMKLGVPPDRIIFNGPAKTPTALTAAVSNNIKLINIDNSAEIDMLDALAAKYGVRQTVGVRVVASVGWASQFGLSLASGQAYEAFRRLSKKSHLEPCGLHLHLGTGLGDLPLFLQAIKEVLEFAVFVERTLNLPIQYLDFGGGFGISTVRTFSTLDHKLMLNNLPPRMLRLDNCLDIDAYANAIIPLINTYFRARNRPLPTVIFEPGRFLTSSAQILLLEALAIKSSTSKVKLAILNGGRNLTMPMAYEYHEIFPAGKMTKPFDTFYNLFGPLCHPDDVLFKGKLFPEIHVGDVIAIMDAGAYFIPNQMNFSNPRPGVVLVNSGHTALVRRHERFEDVIACDDHDYFYCPKYQDSPDHQSVKA